MSDFSVRLSDEEAKDWKPAPPDMTPREEAVHTLEHQLEKDAQAQLLEKNDWNPMALGMLGDAVHDEMHAMPNSPPAAGWSEYLESFMPEAKGVEEHLLVDAIGRAKADLVSESWAAWLTGPLKFAWWCQVKAIRWAVERGLHPYYGAPGEWCFFDAGALIEDMGDDYADVPSPVYKLMKGEVKAGHRCYKTGLEAFHALNDAVATMFEQGLDPDAEAEPEAQEGVPDHEDDADVGDVD